MTDSVLVVATSTSQTLRTGKVVTTVLPTHVHTHTHLYWHTVNMSSAQWHRSRVKTVQAVKKRQIYLYKNKIKILNMSI